MSAPGFQPTTDLCAACDEPCAGGLCKACAAAAMTDQRDEQAKAGEW